MPIPVIQTYRRKEEKTFIEYMYVCWNFNRLEDPARGWKAGRAKRAPPSILRAGEMRQTNVEAAPTAMRSPNFWAGCSQDPAAINHWPRGNYIVLSNCSITYQMVEACLAITVRSERRAYSEAMTIRMQQATPYTCLRTCDCSSLYVEWSWTL